MLENKIKDSLENFEMPYSADAWKAMQEKLDKTQPVSKQRNSNGFYTAILSGALLILTILGWSYFAGIHSNNSAKNSVAENLEKGNETRTYKNSGLETKILPTKKGTIETENTNRQETTFNANKEVRKAVSEKELNRPNTLSIAADTEIKYPPKKVINDPSIKTNLRKDGSINLHVPEVRDLCMGETMTLVNSNLVPLYLVQSTGKKHMIAEQTTYSFTAKEEGIWKIGTYVNGVFESTEEFRVLAQPKIDFTVGNDVFYENGLPTIELKANYTASNYLWTFEKQAKTFSQPDVNVHYFAAGNYSVTLKSKNENGCIGSETKTIRIDKNYNLMAANAFDPLSNDNRKNSFLPYALTERNTPFNLVIIDPRNGNVIFETNDVSKPWDGMDQRSGQLVDANKTYIWKVRLNQPLPGEPSDYKGTILRL
jgi:hypothetical protein